MSCTLLLVALMIADDKPEPPNTPSLNVADVARLLDAHTCSMGEHAPVADAGFDDGLRRSMWSLPAQASLRAITYVQTHRRPGFVAVLLTDLHTRNLTEQSFVARAVGKLPDAPRPAALWAAAGALPNPSIRAVMARTLDDLAPAEQVLVTARAAREREADTATVRVLLLVAAKRGDADAMSALRTALHEPAWDDLRQILFDLDELAPAPALAPLLRTWLDDTRALGTASHIQTENFVVADHAVWMIQRLGVPLDPPLSRLTHVEPALLQRARRALDRIEKATGKDAQPHDTRDADRKKTGP